MEIEVLYRGLSRKATKKRALVYFDRGTKNAVGHFVDQDVPTRIEAPMDFRFVCVFSVSTYKSRYGQLVNMTEGWVSVRRDALANGVVKKKMAYKYAPDIVSGTVQIGYAEGISLDEEGENLMRYCCKPFGQEGDDELLGGLVQENKAWYTQIEPIHDSLKRVQLPVYNKMNLPGWVFMMDMPMALSGGAFFENAIELALRRRDKTATDFEGMPLAHRAVVAADAMQAIANHVLYITDYNISNAGKRTEVDMFSSISRLISGGDCEDSAKEIVMLIVELQRGSFSRHPLARAASDAMRHYVAFIALGTVKGRRHNEDEDDLLAHAYVLLVPRSTLSRNLPEDTKIDVPASRVAPSGETLPVMVLDGTNLKTVEEWPIHFKTGNPSGSFNAFRVATQAMQRIEQAGDRLKAYNDQDDGYYINVSSLLTSSLIKNGTKVYHVYPYNTSLERFGCSFEDVCKGTEGLEFRPTCTPTPEELRACAEAMSLLPPVPAHAFSEAARDAFANRVKTAFEEVAIETDGTLVLKKGPMGQNTCKMFASHEDALSEDMVDSLQELAMTRSYMAIRPEYFSDTCYGLLIVVSN